MHETRTGDTRPINAITEPVTRETRLASTASCMASAPRPAALAGLIIAAIATLSACGGGGSSATTTATASTLSGTAAVGAPITSGKLRILDASGAVVASDVNIDADGRYANITLTGPAPYRIEACGYAGPNYTCVYSVTSGPGTANVTPLTTATVLLASAQSPESLMTGTAPTLTDASVATAQSQLRSSLVNVLASAGITGAFDFISGVLEAGSRSGYDGLLDSIGVTTGKDTQPFVQITPRLGEGNLYLEQNATSGTVTSSVNTAGLQLSGLETLFENMTRSIASPAACANETTGMRAWLAPAARMSLGDGAPAQGADNVAAGLCSFFGQGEDGNTPMWGARFLSPTLGRCDLTGANPVCGVSFVLQSLEGDVQPVGDGMGVTQIDGIWKFKGDLLPIPVQASAKAQRDKRIDGVEPVFDYARALAFEVGAMPGLACAKVAQRDSSSTPVTIAYYKPHPGATGQQRLSLWTQNSFGQSVSLDPIVGATRSADDTWVALPQGADGDNLIRNFYRGGRSVTVSLYGDSACTSPIAFDGKSEFEVEVQGVPPVWSAMTSLPWPEISAATQSAIRDLALDAGATGTFAASWTFDHGPLGLGGATVCGDRAACGSGGTGRIGEGSLRGGAVAATIPLQNTGPAIAADNSKMLALFGRNGEGVDLQSNFLSCTAVGSGERCR